jgi:hypothetical protein
MDGLMAIWHGVEPLAAPFQRFAPDIFFIVVLTWGSPESGQI